ncbi:hypothetical protein FJO69_01475 [[Mycoplasma] falconis]|uniref:DUF3899 domain-containing protein n=1 Tax=[Mycoplasma] falconis TaxID=92403 RepID=A0A501XBA7_9BACT|nr:hypothetical protein [[Mycoplasma] falconis]TPE57584.1 hypothetical protein FJO69_01475 [[Mycoplasma] falconis]
MNKQINRRSFRQYCKSGLTPIRITFFSLIWGFFILLFFITYFGLKKDIVTSLTVFWAGILSISLIQLAITKGFGEGIAASVSSWRFENKVRKEAKKEYVSDHMTVFEKDKILNRTRNRLRQEQAKAAREKFKNPTSNFLIYLSLLLIAFFFIVVMIPLYVLHAKGQI